LRLDQHSLNVSAEGSHLRVQIRTDPRYFELPERSSVREVLGLPLDIEQVLTLLTGATLRVLRLPVAAAEDVLDGKIWAVQEAGRSSPPGSLPRP